MSALARTGEGLLIIACGALAHEITGTAPCQPLG